MRDLFWGLGPFLVMILIFAEWWNYREATKDKVPDTPEELTK